MRALADFLRSHRERIVERWTREVQALPSASGRSRQVIRNHLPRVLDQLASTLEQRAGQDGSAQSAPSVHARERFAEGYDVREVVAEYEILRRTFLESYAAEADELGADARARIRAIAQLDAIIDSAIGDAVDQFVASRDRARDVFVSILGHDLRAPLQSILFAAEAILDRSEALSPTLLLRFAGRVRTSAKRMGDMIGDLLDFTRAHLGGGIPIAPVPVDVRALIREVVDELAVSHAERRIECRARSARGDFRGTWDPIRITQAITNLVGNALEHGDDPIVVEPIDRGPSIAIEVRNHGELAPDAVGGLFRPFAQLGTPARGPRAGLGLGLYIVSEIAHAHHGGVEVESKDGGTTFRLWLPRAANG